MNNAIIINPYTKELKLTPVIVNFKPPKEKTFIPFFNKERKYDKEFFYIVGEQSIKTYKGIYIIVGENIDRETVREIEERIIWCDEWW